jgi:xanthine dehydrogenase small subunit
VLDAQLRLMSWDRHADMICDRELKLDHFIKGYRQTDLGIGELIESIWIPTSSKGLQLHARKISKRWEDDISSVSMVAAFSVNANRVFERLSIAFGGVAEQVIRIHALESLLLGRIISEPLLLEANDVLQKKVRPIDDARASAAYRRAICKELFEEFITIAMAQSTANSRELSH